jgi:protein-tyrosine phosphatase
MVRLATVEDGMNSFFVDCHSHMVPSGDDGVQTVGEGAAILREAHRRGTRLLWCTPHVYPELPLTRRRERQIRERMEQLRQIAGLEVRLGFELTPAHELLEQDPQRYALEGTDRVLMEVPFVGDADLLVALAEYVEEEGFVPVIAHPERTEAVQAQPTLADELADRGWPLQVNASSLTGRHGRTEQRLGWDLLERGIAALVASDGHRQARPPFLDEAWQLAVQRLGAEAARPFFDGSALGLGATEAARQLPSRAVPPAA